MSTSHRKILGLLNAINLRHERQVVSSRYPGPLHILKPAILLLVLLLITSCGNWGWESIETDNEEKLNVFGLISLDGDLESFVVVHKTLETSGPDQIKVGEDSWGNPIYESLYVVKDAHVLISDGVNEYVFERSPTPAGSEDDYRWYGDIDSDPGIYKNTDNTFTPHSNTEYTLRVTTPAGLELQGSTQTPPYPQINEYALPDTVSIRELFKVQWHQGGDWASTIVTEKLVRQDEFICGLEQYGINQPGDTSWTSSVQSWCYEYEPDPGATARMKIRLRFHDENYYNYFLASEDEAGEISNILIGEGGVGKAEGVTGGFGVFGAISSDYTMRIAIP